MKAIKTITLWCTMFVMAMGLVSCDPDSDKGYMLSGKWFGDVGMEINGYPARGSVLEFVPTSYDYTAGYGYETDYYGRFGTTTVSHRFDWYVRDGVIIMRFDNPDLDCRIWEYSLSSTYFTGYMDGYYSQSKFRLKAYSKYWDRDGYWYEDDDYYWPYRASVRSAEPEDNSGAESTEPVCVRMKTPAQP